jgi:tetratricopeptide (TPR) repeat protein
MPFDVFISYAHADGVRVRKIADALRRAGLAVWFDETGIADFASINRGISQGLVESKALVAFYSKTYPLRRACQWELTAAFLAGQREGDPCRRILVVNPEQDAGHIHPIELQDAKFSVAPPVDDPAALDEFAAAVRDRVGVLPGRLAEAQPERSPQWYGMAGVGSTRFVGRVTEMWKIHSTLKSPDVPVISGPEAAGIACVTGLGGIGKSLLAEEYARRFGAAYPGGVFWLRAYGSDDTGAGMGTVEREAERQHQMKGFAAALGVVVEGLSIRELEGMVSAKIEQRGLPYLWVVDDVPEGLDGLALRRWFAPHPLGRTLFTTRCREYGSLAGVLDLGVLPPEEGFALLTARRKPRDGAEEREARGLVEDLGRHPLAIEVSAARLAKAEGLESFAGFRASLAREDRDALELAAKLADALPNGHEKSIAGTLLHSIGRLSEPARDFLRLAASLAVAPIRPLLVAGIFHRIDNLEPAEANERALEALAESDSLSLSEQVDEGFRSVHALVSRAVRFRDSKPDRRDALKASAIDMVAEFLAAALRSTLFSRIADLELPHARQLVSGSIDDRKVPLLVCLAQYDRSIGNHGSAEALCNSRLSFLQRTRNPEDPEVLAAKNDVAEIRRSKGDFAGAQTMHEQVLAARKQVLGPHDPATLASKANLGLTLADLGKWTDARKLQEEVLEERKAWIGPDHLDTAASMGHLATTLRALGDYPGAFELQAKELFLRCQKYKVDQPETMDVMLALADTLRITGNIAKAHGHAEEITQTRWNSLGPGHPDTLRAMTVLGLVSSAFPDRNNRGNACILHEKVWNARERLLGPEHPDTLAAMNNLAAALLTAGDLARAHEIAGKAVALHLRHLGAEHPYTLALTNTVGELLLASGDLPGALPLFQEASEGRRRALGLGNEDTSISAWNLVVVLGLLHRDEESFAVARNELLWLTSRDPRRLGARQQQIARDVAEMVRLFLPGPQGGRS